jgi:metal-responsive CopG/Arc/MetJ family transcriptional regulator
MFQINITLPNDLVKRLEDYVDEKNISRNKLVAELLEKELYRKEVEEMLKELLNIKLLLKAGLTVVGIWITLSLIIIALGG